MNDTLSTDKFDIFEGMTSISAVIKAIQQNLRDRTIVKVLYDSAQNIAITVSCFIPLTLFLNS